MKKISIMTVCMVLSIMAFAGIGYASSCSDVTIDSISKHIRLIPGTEIVAKQPAYGMCEVVLGHHKNQDTGEFAGFYSLLVAPDYVMTARVFSNGEEQASLQNRVEADVFLRTKKNLESVVFTQYEPSGKVENDLYIFTSTKCGYCKGLESRLVKIANDTHTRIHLILFPIHGDDNAKKIICNDVKFNEYISGDWKQISPVAEGCPKSKKMIADALQLGKSLGINGTPTMFTGDGRKIIGANIERIYGELGYVYKETKN